jgi:acetoin utilization deacetylase AcuC-like enzyme
VETSQKVDRIVILYTDPVFEEHETGAHPECPARLASIRRRLAETGLIERCTPGSIRSATREELQRMHPGSYIDRVRRFAESGGGRLDPDTVVCPASYDVACLAAGTVCAAVDSVLNGESRAGLCLVRPPGHHALPERAMGFCLFNNMALAAAHARAAHGLERVLIVDWDVHHGNGTQDMFYEDGHVYFLSAHRYPFYPGTGAADETGSGPGLGATRNLPMQFGVSRQEYKDRFQRELEDFAALCGPQLVLISAGFDAHVRDPIGSLGLESEDFDDLTKLVLQIAAEYCDGRVVSMLEGGYHLEALAESVEVHLRSLLEDSP